MNPKQLSCIVLMMFIGIVAFCGQMAHKKVVVMKEEATAAVDAAIAAEGAQQTAEILATKTRVESEDLRRFLTAWTPHVDKVQTEQDVDNAFELSLRDRSISLVLNRKNEVKNSRENKFIPKIVQTTIIVEDEYAKVLNWFGDIEKRLPLARVTSCSVTGGATVRHLRLDVTLETPIIDVSADPVAAEPTKKKT